MSTTDNLSSVNITAAPPRNTIQTDLIVGCLLIITSLGGLIAYIPCVVAFYKSKSFRSPCYTFMISLGVSDSVSLLCWTGVGIYTCAHGELIPDKAITVMFCLLSYGWKCMKSHEAAIAINRYISICHASRKEQWYGGKWKMIGWLTFVWLFATIENIPSFMPPNMAYTLDGYYAVWMNKDITTFSSYEDLTGCTLVFLISVFCYTAVMIKFRKVRQQVGNKNNNNNRAQQEKDRKDFTFQVRLAAQTSIRSFTFYIYDILYYVISLYSNDLMVIFVCGTYLWCLTNAMNPWIYLIFNSHLRKESKTFMTINKSSAVV